MPRRASVLLLVQYLSLVIHQCIAIVLQDVRPSQPYSLFRRDDYSVLSLKDEEYFIWGRKCPHFQHFVPYELTKYRLPKLKHSYGKLYCFYAWQLREYYFVGEIQEHA